MGPLGALREPLETDFGLGPSRAIPGPLLGLPWALLGALGAYLGRSWQLLAALGPPWGALGSPWGPFCASWAALGAPWAAPKSLSAEKQEFVDSMALFEVSWASESSPGAS